MHYDGIGACEFQLKKGSKGFNLDSVNKGAIDMAYPLAKSRAIKDACDHFGALFGANLSRKNAAIFEGDDSIQNDTLKDPMPLEYAQARIDKWMFLPMAAILEKQQEKYSLSNEVIEFIATSYKNYYTRLIESSTTIEQLKEAWKNASKAGFNKELESIKDAQKIKIGE